MGVKLNALPQVTITTGGTRVRLSSAPVSNAVEVYISAPLTNTGNVWIGGNTVAAGVGIEVVKGTTLVLRYHDMIDIYEIYADGTTGDKVSLAYMQRIS